MRTLILFALATGCDNRLTYCPPTETRDPLVHQSRSNTATFFETTDAVALPGAVWTCTGVAGMVTHDASDPERLRDAGSVSFPGSDSRYPRCSHLDAQGDRVAVVAHRDEVQPRAWVALVDASDPLQPRVLASRESDLLLEEPALDGDRVLVAAHEDGIAVYDATGDVLSFEQTVGGLGNVGRVAVFNGGVLAGTLDNRLWVLSPDLTPRLEIPLDAAVQGIQDLGDGRAAVALGGAGLVIVDLDSGDVTARVDTRGTALRLDCLDEDTLLVANWTDVRVYDVSGDAPALLAVDAVFEAGEQPRHLAAAGRDRTVYAGEWTGVHALRLDRSIEAPEFTPDVLSIKVPDDGAAHEATIAVTNEGRAPLTLQKLDPPRGWTAGADFASLSPGATGSLTVSFEGGEASGADWFNVCTDDPDEAPARISVSAGSDALTVGDAALDFSYIGVNTGEAHSLSAERGNVVVLSYFATF